MKRVVLSVIFLLLVISVAAPSIAFAQELLPMPEMVAPAAMVIFGLMGLVGGSAAYLRRRSADLRPEGSPESRTDQ